MIPMRRLRTLAASLAAAFVSVLAAVPTASAQQRVLVDFAKFRSASTREYQATPGGEVSSKGLSVYASFTAGSRNALGTWGTVQDPQHLPTNLGPTAAAMWGTQFGERMDLEATDGRLFNLFSMDVGHLYNRSYLISGDLAPIDLFFYGFNEFGQVALATAFAIPAPAIVGGQQAPVLSTLVFGGDWRRLSGVAWFQASGPFNAQVLGSGVSHQFTNISASVIPEPSTYLLMASGLAGVLVIARRRRAS